MLDISFSELLLIAVIALVVLGPERLPAVIRTTAYWVGKLRRSFQNAKEELERELNVEEMKRQIHNENVMRELKKAKASLNESPGESSNEHSRNAVDSERAGPKKTPASNPREDHPDDKKPAL